MLARSYVGGSSSFQIAQPLLGSPLLLFFSDPRLGLWISGANHLDPVRPLPRWLKKSGARGTE